MSAKRFQRTTCEREDRRDIFHCSHLFYIQIWRLEKGATSCYIACDRHVFQGTLGYYSVDYKLPLYVAEADVSLEVAFITLVGTL